MQPVTAVGLDIVRSVFQVHCVDAADQVVIRRQLKRRWVLAFFQKPPRYLLGIEAAGRHKLEDLLMSQTVPVIRSLSGTNRTSRQRQNGANAPLRT